MRLALGIIFTNELTWLKFHLPRLKPEFDGVVSITDPLTTDGSLEYMYDTTGITPLIQPWTYHWGEFATKLADYAEQLGYDGFMRLDPDEVVMPGAGAEIKRMLVEEATLLCFPRYNFFGDRAHLWQGQYPDYQMRAWRLRRGIKVYGEKHESIYTESHDLHPDTLNPDHRVQWVSDPHIYHYGWASKTGIWYQMTKYQSQAQVAEGGPPEVAWPADKQMFQAPTEEYTGPQPIPDCGLYAPYEE